MVFLFVTKLYSHAAFLYSTSSFSYFILNSYTHGRWQNNHHLITEATQQEKRSLNFSHLQQKISSGTLPFLYLLISEEEWFPFAFSYLCPWYFSLFVLLYITRLLLLFDCLEIYFQLKNVLKISLSLNSFPQHCFPLKLLSHLLTAL